MTENIRITPLQNSNALYSSVKVFFSIAKLFIPCEDTETLATSRIRGVTPDWNLPSSHLRVKTPPLDSPQGTCHPGTPSQSPSGLVSNDSGLIPVLPNSFLPYF